MLKNLPGSLAIAATIVFFCIPAVAAAEYVPQTSDVRGIKITVAPKDIQDKAQTWDFEVTAESHTRDLSDDLTKSSVLVVDGKQYLPAGWEGAPPGGHHRKGLLRFKAIVPKPGSVELQIRLAGDASLRSFKWMLK